PCRLRRRGFAGATVHAQPCSRQPPAQPYAEAGRSSMSQGCVMPLLFLPAHAFEHAKHALKRRLFFRFFRPFQELVRVQPPEVERRHTCQHTLIAQAHVEWAVLLAVLNQLVPPFRRYYFMPLFRASASGHEHDFDPEGGDRDWVFSEREPSIFSISLTIGASTHDAMLATWSTDSNSGEPSSFRTRRNTITNGCRSAGA